MVYEDYGHVAPGLPEKGTLREKRKKKTDRMELKAPLHFAGSAADAVKEMAKKGVTPPFKKIVHNVSNHTSIVLNLRTTTRWVDELWAARIQAAHRDGMQNLPMDPVASAAMNLVFSFGINSRASMGQQARRVFTWATL